ncbi:hypothetical protein HZS_631 [Henneguya salminicola]|nr:hypothetical protein HZS_631 [Henneguya salminicola]
MSGLTEAHSLNIYITDLSIREYEFTRFLVTFDFNNEITYFGFGPLIFKSPLKSRTSVADLILILHTDDDIVSLQFDPLSNSLLFLNSKNTLSVVSLEKLYQKEILSDIKSFSLHSDKELFISRYS